MPQIEFGQLQADLPTYQNSGAIKLQQKKLLKKKQIMIIYLIHLKNMKKKILICMIFIF